MVRRIAQGNPRIFIRIMNDLFNKAIGHPIPLILKSQHSVIEAFAKSFCKETKTLESVGPEVEQYLDYIATSIQEKTHGEKLIQTGLTFKLRNAGEFQKHVTWLKKSVAFSRIQVDNNSLITGITADSVFELSNLYAANYWLPMRSKTPTLIALPSNISFSYIVNSHSSLDRVWKKSQKNNVDSISDQLSLFSGQGGQKDEN